MVKIKDIPISDRPMERLVQNGVETLSNEELIAIILKTGTKGKSAKELSSLLLSKIGGIKKLYDLNYEYLNKFKGIGKSKACILLAIMELSKRINREVDTIKNIIRLYFHRIHSRDCDDVRNTICRICIHSEEDNLHSHRYICRYVCEVKRSLYDVYYLTN